MELPSVDAQALIFYAIVCGLLSGISPGFRNTLARISFGAVVGMTAAYLLPSVRALLG